MSGVDPDPVPREHPHLTRRMSEWLTSTQDVRFPYGIDVLRCSFLVLPGVFSPRYYPETEFYAAQLVDRVVPGERWLDLGCGIGVNAVLCAQRGARVTALDVNPDAVRNTIVNSWRHGVTDAVDVRVSDIFSAVTRDEEFDKIYWNVPFAFRPAGIPLTLLEEAVFDPGYRKNREFLRTGAHHLSAGGEILMGVSETLGDLPAILRTADRAGFTVAEIARSPEVGTADPTLLQLLSLRRRG
jgi:release factor glutamine methyltransferase